MNNEENQSEWKVVINHLRNRAGLILLGVIAVCLLILMQDYRHFVRENYEKPLAECMDARKAEISK